MGSGLILLVIVGAWLAVLVPMGLRSHDAPAGASAHERLGSAVRVLSRRTAAAPLDDEQKDDEQKADEQDVDDYLDEEVPAPRWAERLEGLRAWRPPAGARRLLLGASGRLLHSPAALLRRARGIVAERRADRLPATPAARRRRVLLTLGGLTVLAALAGRGGPAWLLDVAGLSAVGALLFLVSCRRCAARRESLTTRAPWIGQPQVQEPAAAAVTAASPDTAASPELFDLEQLADLEALEPAVAPRRRSRPAAGGAWQPVPVPLPLYVGSSRARVRVVEPEPWSGAQDDDDEQGVFEPRRVVSGW